MPTRFYFQASGSPAISPAFDSGWEQTGQAVRLPMPRKATLSVRTALADGTSITVPITTTQQILHAQLISDDIFLPVRLDASVLWSVVVRTSESTTDANVKLAYVLRAFPAAGGTSLGTLASQMNNTGTEYSLTGAPSTRIFGDGTTTVALTPATLSVPWRLVLELGGHANSPVSAQSYIHRLGCNAASDFALTSALTTDLNPWMELSVNLQAVRANNYQHARAGSGISVSERIR